jgi:hypothetical protein
LGKSVWLMLMWSGVCRAVWMLLLLLLLLLA